MGKPPAAPSITSPYRGAAPYEARHEKLFFGRGLDAEDLLLRIYGQRLVLLHASSGVGKTSLLRASVIPELERRGLLVAISKPHHHPSLGLRRAVLDAVLPPPAAECAAIDRLLEIAARHGSAPTASLRELCIWEAQTLSPRDRDYELLRSPLGSARLGSARTRPTGARVTGKG